ncbi:N-acetyltransferase [Microbacterium sp. OVT16B]|uniref:GNAT family N-acetyltransferase n=1 Tax=Microbacterium sp. OVT16B TaxID=2862682 RepID=UPI001CBB08C3|nr:GNAT family N-acetyltransferase [Microbacterium sp. OVT16B]
MDDDASRIERVSLDDPRLHAIAAEELHQRLHGIPVAVARPLVEVQLTSKFAGLLAQHPDAVGLLLSMDGAPVAYAVTADAVDSAAAVRLCDIAVSATARGRGVGGRLLSIILGEADAAEAVVTLSVWHDAAARGWYERRGFVVAGGDSEGYLEMRREPAGEYPGIHSVA